MTVLTGIKKKRMEPKRLKMNKIKQSFFSKREFHDTIGKNEKFS